MRFHSNQYKTKEEKIISQREMHVTHQKEPVMGVTRRRQIATRTGRISIPSAPDNTLESIADYVSLVRSAH